MKIKDESLSPYIIKTTDYSFDVFEEHISGEDSNNPGSIIEKNIGYFTDIESALNKIVKLKVNNRCNEANLSTYFTLMREEKNKIFKVL